MARVGVLHLSLSAPVSLRYATFQCPFSGQFKHRSTYFLSGLRRIWPLAPYILFNFAYFRIYIHSRVTRIPRWNSLGGSLLIPSLPVLGNRACTHISTQAGRNYDICRPCRNECDSDTIWSNFCTGDCIEPKPTKI